MLRCSFVFTGLVSVAIASAGGCRACSSCHDYDSPVANCQCGACNAPCGCGSTGGCTGGCNGSTSGGCNCGGEHSAPAYVPSSRPGQTSVAPRNGAQQNGQAPAQQIQQSTNGAEQQ